jgi:glycosyltransferase involved in cell wall biosynthesis
MKLLQIVWNFPDTVTRPFGMYYFYWPVREAVLRGWDAEVLTFQVEAGQPAEEIIDGIRVRRRPARSGKWRAFSWSFIHSLLTTDADIIHCHGYGEGQSELAILIARLRGCKVIFSPYMHIYPYRRSLRDLYDRTIGRFFFNLSDRVIVSTQFTHQKLVALGVHADKLCVIPHVSRPEVFASDSDDTGRTEAAKILYEEGVTGNPLILGVGRLIRRKGWEYTVRCLPAIVERFPEAKLLILGHLLPGEEDFPGQLMHLAGELGVRDHIHILRNNAWELMREAYCSATILTHPSEVESFGIVLLEAMIAGLPVVAHSGTGLPCIIDDGVTGRIVDVHDIPAYTEAMLSLLNDPDLRQRMGAEGHRQAVERFGQAVVAPQLFAVYEEVIGRVPPPTVETPVKENVTTHAMLQERYDAD